MIRTHHRAARRIAASAAAAALALGIGSCSGEDDPETTSSDTSSQSSRESGDGDEGGGSGEDAPGTDQSDALFDAYSDPKPVGKATDGDKTLEVFQVHSTTTGTRLAFHISSPELGTVDIDARNWSDFPEIVDTSGKTAYQPLTATQPEHGNKEEQLLCLCTGQNISMSKPRMQTVLYETLPKDVTSVDVTFGDFDPITVKVTR